MEAAFSNQQSAVSERQNQHQNQKPFTAEDAKDAEDAKEEKGLNQRPFTAEVAEEAKEKEGVQQRAEALAVKLAQTYEELTRLLERNPGMKVNKSNTNTNTFLPQRGRAATKIKAFQKSV